MGGDRRRLPGALFSPEVPSLLVGPRGRRFLTSFVFAPPRPSVLVPGWCFLVAAAAVVCVTDPRCPWPGCPCPPSASPLGCGTSACLFAWPPCPVFPSLVAGLRLVASQSRLCATRLRGPAVVVPPLSTAPRPEAVVPKWLSARGLGGEWRSCLLPTQKFLF